MTKNISLTLLVAVLAGQGIPRAGAKGCALYYKASGSGFCKASSIDYLTNAKLKSLCLSCRFACPKLDYYEKLSKTDCGRCVQKECDFNPSTTPFYDIMKCVRTQYLRCSNINADCYNVPNVKGCLNCVNSHVSRVDKDRATTFLDMKREMSCMLKCMEDTQCKVDTLSSTQCIECQDNCSSATKTPSPVARQLVRSSGTTESEDAQQD